MALRRYKDTMMKVVMQNGQTTTRFQTGLNTRWRGSEVGDGAEVSGGGRELEVRLVFIGRLVVIEELVDVGFSVERISCQVNIWMNELLKSKVTSSPVTETQLGGDSPTLLMLHL